MCILERVSRVRIPPSPQDQINVPAFGGAFCLERMGRARSEPDVEIKMEVSASEWTLIWSLVPTPGSPERSEGNPAFSATQMTKVLPAKPEAFFIFWSEASMPEWTGRKNRARSAALGLPERICIELFSQPDSVNDKQQIILITNSKLQSYGIPLLSNTGKPNTTFEKELNMCFTTINLNDTIGTSARVLRE